MKIEEAFEIDVAIDRMFRDINDIGQIGYCIAGVKQVEVVSEDESRWKVEAKAGFMARTFNLTGRITERRPPEYLAFAGAGQDVEITGHVRLSSLTPSRTRCEAVVEATVVGPFASIVDLMAKGPQQALIRETIDNLRTRLSSAGEPSAGEPEEAPAQAPPHLVPDAEPKGPLARFLVWFRSLFSRSG